jgi:transposase-like protein
MSVTEQRYKAVLEVIGNGRTMTEVARDWGVSRKTLHAWLARYELAGLEGLNNLSHRPWPAETDLTLQRPRLPLLLVLALQATLVEAHPVHDRPE